MNKFLFRKAILAGALALSAAFWAAEAQAGYSVLYSFNGKKGAEDPVAGVIVNNAGDLAGTTAGGKGVKNGGTVYTLAGAKEKVLISFDRSGHGGATPRAGVIEDSSGKYYGTTSLGGTGTACGTGGCGTVFEIPSGKKTARTIYSFAGGSDGQTPVAGLIEDSAGNLYGTTQVGGGGSCACGTVFKIAPSGTESVLYAFKGGSGDGAAPTAGLVLDTAGNLYGTASVGGGTGCFDGNGCGIVFKVAPDGAETILHAFAGGGDGELPNSTLVFDNVGNLYGTTTQGGGGTGAGCSTGGLGCGTIFEITAGGTERVLYAFQGGTDGAGPSAGVTFDNAGNLYGTTAVGGGGAGCTTEGCGTIFELTAAGTESVLHAFASGTADGQLPFAGLSYDGTGHLYGTTSSGGKNDQGIVFEYAP